jgi:hypothetical protein
VVNLIHAEGRYALMTAPGFDRNGHCRVVVFHWGKTKLLAMWRSSVYRPYWRDLLRACPSVGRLLPANEVELAVSLQHQMRT